MARKSSTSSLALRQKAKPAHKSSLHTTISHAHKAETSSPLKHSSTLSPSNVRNNMSAHTSPTKQAAAGASPNKSPSKSSASPTKPTISPKKEDFSIKRAMSNALTPKRLRQERPPTPPKKDTPPAERETPPHLRLSANITDVARPSDAYSSNGFSTALDNGTRPNRSRETITIALGDDCSPVKEVKSGTFKMTHQPYSLFKGQQATFEVDPEVAREIDEEFQSPAMPNELFRSPRLDKDDAAKSAGKTEADKTPRYVADGLLEGGLLPATTYQPPPPKPKAVIYSPSMYSVTNGHDVFRASSYHAAAQEFTATTPAPPNSPVSKEHAKAEHEVGDGHEEINEVLPHPRMDPIRYLGTVRTNKYVYRPEDHVYERRPGETPILTHDFAATSAQQQKKVPVVRAQITPISKVDSYGGPMYEHPSAVPPPLRRTSRENSSHGSSGRSLRDRFIEQGGLGINLFEGADYAKDNETTVGVDGDGYGERLRETAAMSPGFSDGHVGVRASTLPHKAEEQKNMHWTAKFQRDMYDTMDSLHERQVDKIESLDNKLDRIVQTGFQNQNSMASLRNAVDHTFADNRKLRENVDAIVADQRETREAVDAIFADNSKICASISDLTDHTLDDEKLDLLVDRIIGRLHPTIVRGFEKSDFHAERIMSRVDKCHDQMAKELDSLKRKNKKTNERITALANQLSTPCNGHMSAVRPSPSSSNGYLDPTAEYTEPPSER